jgi:chorismate synthase
MKLDIPLIQAALDRRKPGQGPGSTPRKEPDVPEILSGLFQGKTTGTPIQILIRNRDADSRAYAANASAFRPGHGDITYQAK